MLAPTQTPVLQIEYKASPKAAAQVMDFPVEPHVQRALRVLPRALERQFSSVLTSSDVAGLTTKAMEAYFSSRRAKPGRCSSDVEKLCKRAAIAAVLQWNPRLFRKSGFLPQHLALPTIDIAFECAVARFDAWEAKAFRPELKEFLAIPSLESTHGRRRALVEASALIGSVFDQRLNGLDFVRAFERGWALERREGRSMSHAAGTSGAPNLATDFVDLIREMTKEGMKTLFRDRSGTLCLDEEAVRDLNTKQFNLRSRAAKRETPLSVLGSGHAERGNRVDAPRDLRELAPHQRLAAADVIRRLRRIPTIGVAARKALADCPAVELEERVAALDRLRRALERCQSVETQAAVVYVSLNESRERVAQMFQVSAREIRRREGEARRLLVSAAEDDR